MALFKSKEKKEEKQEAPVEVKATTKKEVAKKAEVSKAVAPVAAHVLLSARVTEKATDMASNENTYVFNVTKSANKQQVRDAIKVLYKVTPIAIRMVKVAPKTTRHPKAGLGLSKSGKKAYVKLKEGDVISLM